MPFKLRLGKRSQQYNVTSKELFVIPISLLDLTTVECTLLSTSLGIECLHNVCQRISLAQPDFFGLLFLSKRDNSQWIDLERPVKKQLDKLAVESRLYLRVQFFLPDLTMLSDEVTRYHYFLQLKSQVIEGRLKINQEDAISLASYSLQAEFGDYNPERHTSDYLSNFALLPRNMVTSNDIGNVLLEYVINAYRNLRGVPTNEAEILYIREAQKFDGFGQEGFPAKDSESGAEVCLGVSLYGIFVNRYQKVETFKWTDIANLIHQKKVFTIELNPNGRRKNFIMFDGDYARFAWRVSVEQHQYFIKGITLKQSKAETPPVKNGNCQINNNHDGINSGHLPIHSVPSGTRISSENRDTVDHNLSSLPYKLDDALLNLNKLKFAFTNSDSQLLPDSSMTHQNANLNHITTVQVHQEPSWLASNQPNPTEKLDWMKPETRSILPPYKPPPDYDTYLKNRTNLHSLSVSNLPSHISNSNHLSNMSLATGACTSKFNMPQFAAHSYAHYQNFSDLSNLESDASSKHQGVNIYTSVISPDNNAKVLTKIKQLTGANAVTNSTPELNSLSVIKRNVDEIKMPISNKKNLIKNYLIASYPCFNSVPNLTEQQINQQSSSSTHPFQLAPQLVTSNKSNQLPDMDYLSFPSGSEPNLPQTPVRPGLTPLIKPLVSNSCTGKHLSLDGLNLAQQTSARLVNPNEVKPDEANNSEAQKIANVYIVSDNLDGAASFPVHNTTIITSTTTTNTTSTTTNITTTPSSSSATSSLFSCTTTTTACATSSLITTTATTSALATEMIQQPTSECNLNDKNRLMPELGTDLNELNLGSKQENLKMNVSDNSSALFENDTNVGTQTCKDPRVVTLEKRCNGDEFTREFEMIPRMKPTATFSTALLLENVYRNRFRNILPYDDNRVRLVPTKDNKTGYINASYIIMRTENMSQYYIAAQGPLAHTVIDFWQMIKENSISLIVMVTDLVEGDQEKCYPYYPLSSDQGKNVVKFGEFEIQCNFSIVSCTYVTSSLTMRQSDGSTHSVYHIRYTDWPDHTCPQDVQGFLSFLEGIDAIYRLNAREGSSLLRKKSKTASSTFNTPVLVHCSAGVGRSGVVILCDFLLRSLDFSIEIEVPKVLCDLRFQRMRSVQNLDQYRFIYNVFIQYLKNSRLI